MFEEKIERAGNTNRREHPDGLMEEQMLDNESIDVTGLAWGEILRKHSQEGKKWLWYRNGREVLEHAAIERRKARTIPMQDRGVV